MPTLSPEPRPPRTNRPSSLELLQAHVANLDLILECLDRILLKYRTAWKNLENVYNEALTLRAVYRRTIDMLQPHAGVAHQRGFRLRLLPVLDLLQSDIHLKLTHSHQELTKLLDDKMSLVMRRRADQDSAWNAPFLATLGKNWAMERRRLESSMTSIKL